jgi:hypothetical protein
MTYRAKAEHGKTGYGEEAKTERSSTEHLAPFQQ